MIIVWQTVRRITNEILGVKGLIEKRLKNHKDENIFILFKKAEW